MATDFSLDLKLANIKGEVWRWQAHTARGALYDAFELRKSKGKPNKLISQIPATPENRRPPKK